VDRHDRNAPRGACNADPVIAACTKDARHLGSVGGRRHRVVVADASSREAPTYEVVDECRRVVVKVILVNAIAGPVHKRIDALCAFKAFLHHYRHARLQWTAGRSAVFPPGTYGPLGRAALVAAERLSGGAGRAFVEATREHARVR
jgi:hypothetical protein